MRFIVIIFLMFLFWSCTSCTENKPANDSLMSDIDNQAVLDLDTHDISNNESDAPDISDENVSENDVDTDVSDDEFIDDCDIKLIDAPFPYYDNDGNITFCRPGCDTPAEKDPQCMSNLWKEQNYNLCHEFPEYDCCGYPCVLETLKPMTKEEEDEWGEYGTTMNKCDLKINPKNWGIDGSNGVIKSWNMSEGKIGLFLYTTKLTAEEWSVQSKYVAYEIETQKYNFIIPARNQEQSYYKGHRVAMVSDKRTLELNNSNIFLAYIGDDGSQEIVFNKIIDHLPYEPALNDKWVFVNLRYQGNPSKMMYAKVGEWKWTELGEGTARYSRINDNYLGIYDDKSNGYLCDLSKSPNSFADCAKINRDDESVAVIVFNEDNPEEIIYNSMDHGIVLARLNENKFEYSDIITDFSDETKLNPYTISPYYFKGNILLYVEITYRDDKPGGHLCYYRTDKKKKYCMKKMDKDDIYSDGTTRFPYGFSEFEGKWLLYQKINSTSLILRDMNCYCKEEGVCPFEE